MLRVSVLTILLAAVAAVLVDDATLDSMLQNPSEMGKVFVEFEEKHHRGSSQEERSMRFRAFRKHAQEISVHNHGDSTWKEGMNHFADMTDDERHSFLGLNVTNVQRMEKRQEREDEGSDDGAADDEPLARSWIRVGAVTEIKNQGSCGSCWAFGAMGALEGAYKLKTGVLRNFAEEQMLDCTYPERDGCGGGWMRDGVDSVRVAGKLASTADYPYRGADGSCSLEEYPNSMVGANVEAYVEIEEGEVHTIRALSLRPLAVTINVRDSFFSYTSGIYRDNTRTSFPNHALTAVAYTEQYILIKNSWGSEWGDDGFIKVARNYDGCSFHRFVGYAVLSYRRGSEDNNESDRATDYNAGDDEGPDPGPDPEPCVETFTGCKEKFCKYSLIKEGLAQTSSLSGLQTLPDLTCG
ncbi:uncharacterized protein LOC134824781 [Bolinopsis microptera]|uniref:uncharacterized protein LOC134824781 n=1 Tax=Bolinopsis microptera TaxID=2820187 RepID=UPI003079C511